MKILARPQLDGRGNRKYKSQFAALKDKRYYEKEAESEMDSFLLYFRLKNK